MEIALLTYLVTSTLAYGNMFAYFQREWPDIAKETKWTSAKASLIALVPLAGPIGIFCTLGFFRHGIKFI